MGNTTEISHLKKLGNITFIPNGWTLTTVGQACNIKNNLRKPLSVDERKKIQGEYPYYGPTGILDYIDHYMCDGKFALIGEDGDHYLKPKEKSQTILVDGKFNVNNHAHIVEGTNICSVEWFYTYFRNRDITHMLSRQGANRYKLNKQTLEGMPILLPCLSEQKAIADTLQTWDTAIEKTQTLIAAKEKTFLRLRATSVSASYHETTWRNCKLDDYIEERTIKSDISNLYPCLTSSRRGIFLQDEYFSKQIASKNNVGYKVVMRGDFAFRTMSDDLTFVFNQQNIIDKGIISPAYGVFTAKKNIDQNFLYYFLNSPTFMKIMLKEVQGGTRVALKLSNLKKLIIKLPPLTEQKAIAETLSTAQKEIDILKKLVEKYQLQKRGLMQKLLTGEWRLDICAFK